ncbi:putative reverse transcriptase domain, reverse transcriptase zinc-binding domain protein [Tanacetum coccineum]
MASILRGAIRRVSNDKPKPFKFFNFLAYKTDFKKLVTDDWGLDVNSYNMFKLVKRMHCLKKLLRKLLHSHGNLHNRVANLYHELDEMQKALDKNPSSICLREEEASYLAEFTQATLNEERFLKQKAKIEWLRVGDANSSYFHKSVKSKASDVELRSAMFSIGNDKTPGPDRAPLGCAFKIDIQKAYDTVNWKFLEHILVGFGFHSNMDKWIMACATRTSFSININGELHGHFRGKCGLRQGDPISTCSKQKIINMCFTDDLIMVARGDVLSARVLMEALYEFKGVSGEIKRGKVNVSWEDVCLPKVEGGLGVHRLEMFNAALMSTHIWKLITHKESMWIRRIFLDRYGVLDVRIVIFKCLRLSSRMLINNAGFDLQATVSNVVAKGVWMWPTSWFNLFPILTQENPRSVRSDGARILAMPSPQPFQHHVDFLAAIAWAVESSKSEFRCQKLDAVVVGLQQEVLQLPSEETIIQRSVFTLDALLLASYPILPIALSHLR